MANFLKTHWKAISWAAIILILSGIPGHQVPDVKLLSIPHFDKILHVSMYFIFTLLLMSGNNKYRLKGKLTAEAVIWASLISLPFGIIMEFLQHYLFVSRSAEVGDVAANVGGYLLALITYRPTNRITGGFI